MNHIKVVKHKSIIQPPMIVMHGLLGCCTNWHALCRSAPIRSKRDSYLVELRNHAQSDHHSDMDHYAISDDIIRFADSQRLNTFTVLGHSLGGRAAMTTACRYPDRVDGVISVDSPPVDVS